MKCVGKPRGAYPKQEARSKRTDSQDKDKMARLDKERQSALEPKRMQYAADKIRALGLPITLQTEARIDFTYKGNNIILFPYSGWFSGKGVKSGRGIDNLIKQIEDGV